MAIGFETPTKVVMKYERVSEQSICGLTEYTLYVNGQEYKSLPLDANVREPDTKKQIYKDILDTLGNAPEDFFENNLGITIIAKSVDLKPGNKCQITFSSGTGILNGGHTQLAILNSQDKPSVSKAIVKLTIRVKDYSPKRIAQIASALNSSTSVKPYSLAEKKGLFGELKNKLDDDIKNHIIWYEGKTVAGNKGMEPNDLIAILNMFNIFSYQSDYSKERAGEPTTSSSSKSTVWNNWEQGNNTTLEKIYPLANDILRLYELIQLKFCEGTGMSALKEIKAVKGNGKDMIFSDDTCKYNIPKQMLYPLLAAYRANVYYNKAEGKIGWYEDNKELVEKYNKTLCHKLKVAYKDLKNLNVLGKNAIAWEAVYNALDQKIDKNKVTVQYSI